MLVPTSCAHHKWQSKLAIELSISCIMQESHFLFQRRHIKGRKIIKKSAICFQKKNQEFKAFSNIELNVTAS
jgi:hypothetical protein